MRTAIVRYRRNNADDLAFAFKNFPKLESDPRSALLAQFKQEMTRHGLRFPYAVICDHHTEERLWIWLRFNVPDDLLMSDLMQMLRKPYIECGITPDIDLVDVTF